MLQINSTRQHNEYLNHAFNNHHTISYKMVYSLCKLINMSKAHENMSMGED